MVAVLVACGAALVTAAAEMLHARRCRRLARLAFGPSERPAFWVYLAPVLRIAAVSALAWGFVTLLLVKPMTYRTDSIPDSERRHLVLVLDVSPSMALQDAGPEGKQSRKQRVSSLIRSLFERVPMSQYLISVVACYNGSKPVVEDTRDMEVVRNILDDLPMNYAFDVGKTDLFSALEAVAEMSRPWNPGSALVVMLTDGDTVPASGMPQMPASVSHVLLVGVGDPVKGSFIDGGMSRQDASTLRQMAVRLRGTYHNGNEKHLPTELLRHLTASPGESAFEKLTEREYALIALALGGSVLAFLPLALHLFGTRWTPGVPASRVMARNPVRTRRLSRAGQEVSVG